VLAAAAVLAPWLVLLAGMQRPLLHAVHPFLFHA
jgi:hypothetical protein